MSNKDNPFADAKKESIFKPNDNGLQPGPVIHPKKTGMQPAVKHLKMSGDFIKMAQEHDGIKGAGAGAAAAAAGVVGVCVLVSAPVSIPVIAAVGLAGSVAGYFGLFKKTKE